MADVKVSCRLLFLDCCISEVKVAKRDNKNIKTK